MKAEVLRISEYGAQNAVQKLVDWIEKERKEGRALAFPPTFGFVDRPQASNLQTTAWAVVVFE